MENHLWNDHRGWENTDGLQKGLFRLEPLQTRPLPQLSLPKACTQCGATRTPQWREGPDGPKTLCNACGVKLSRQIKKGAGPKQRGAGHGRPAVPTEQSLLRHAPSAHMEIRTGAVDLDKRVLSACRTPQRKAANKAGSRTTENAASRNWPNDECRRNSASTHQRRSSDAVCQAFHSTHSAGSDLPDELHMHPGQFSPEVFVRVRCPAGTSVRPSSSGFASQIGETSAAAVNLLCLAGGRQKCHDQLQAEECQDPAPYNVTTVLQHLPVEDALQVIKNDLDNTLRDVHVADTVAAAVAEVLAKKQSLANDAWSRHKQARKRLRDLKASIEVQEEVDWMPQPSKKRQKSF